VERVAAESQVVSVSTQGIWPLGPRQHPTLLFDLFPAFGRHIPILPGLASQVDAASLSPVNRVSHCSQACASTRYDDCWVPMKDGSHEDARNTHARISPIDALERPCLVCPEDVLREDGSGIPSRTAADGSPVRASCPCSVRRTSFGFSSLCSLCLPRSDPMIHSANTHYYGQLMWFQSAMVALSRQENTWA
jgi:hypothetical protein